ncbi:MAG: transglycosylase SLT domain-containing protein [Vicinamibacterales bacterium]
MKVVFIALVAASAIIVDAAARQDGPQLDTPRRASAIGSRLAPTEHPPLPGHPSHFWLLPDPHVARAPAARAEETPLSRFARGVKRFARGDYAGALPLVSVPGLASTPVAGYARYYTAFTQLRLERVDEAEKTLRALAATKPTGALAEVLALRRAEAAEAKNDPRAALAFLEPLSRETTTAPEAVLLRIARAAGEARERDKAIAYYRRVYFEFPLSAEADLAKVELDALEKPVLVTPDRFALELGRAERLFGARRYKPAHDGFASLSKVARGDDRELVALRLAECDYYLRRYRASRDALRPYLDDGKRKAEARFFHLTAIRALGDFETYVALARGLVNDFPQESWAEETLNNLASHYIIEDDDAAADGVFRELSRRFPLGRHAERAAWKIGWWAYKNGDPAEAIAVFEGAAAAMARADARPAWLYWAARSHDELGQRDAALARYRLVATDYFNSYYGRLASKILADRKAPPVTPSVTAASAADAAGTLVPTDGLIRQLVALELYDDAMSELLYAQRAWGDSPAIQATLAWIRHQQGLEMTSFARFERLRGAINQMKRAYPQYLAAGGEELPAGILRVLFPLDYWPLIRKYSSAHNLDPYVIAALMAQESTFTADIRSAANAYGLMQVIPATGRRYARSLGIRRFSTAALTNPETNVRIGTAYFKDLLTRFGGAHFALASYNAGEHRVARWIAERPGLEQDEFIDDIPFPETQNYVKKVLGTAEDYRRLYGGGVLTPLRGSRPTPPGAASKKPVASREP